MSKNLIVFITPREENFCFNFVTFNLTTGNKVTRCSKEVKDLIKFFDTPPDFVEKYVKGICVQFAKNGTIDYGFYQQLATKLRALKIPFRFMTDLHITAMCALIGVKIDPDVDKEILQIYFEPYMIRILSLCRTENGYFIEKIQEIPILCDLQKLMMKVIYPSEVTISNVNEIGEEHILKMSFSSKIILSNSTAVIQNKTVLDFKEGLAKWKPIVFKRGVKDYLFDAVKKIVDHMYAMESSKKYFLIPQLFSDLGISGAGENPSQDDMLVFAEKNTSLPLIQSCSVSRFYKQFYLLNKSNDSFKIIQPSHEITKDAHRYKLSLSIDINNCPTITHETVILSKIKNMPKRLKIENTQKLPIIGFFDNSSVICVWNEDESCYKYLDSWNGKFGKDLYLDFMLPKPTLMASSTDVTTLSGAVYDLIKIMSIPPDDVEGEKQWKFTFTKNDENPVLLEFDTFENERKAATPAFLMALILKGHIRAIRKEIGEKPKKLGFRLFDDFENVEAKKRVEAGLQKACKMKDIECCFV